MSEIDARELGPMQTAGLAVSLGDEGAHIGGGDQSKLTLNEPGDRYEQEAERVARAIVPARGTTGTVESREPPLSARVQRLCPRCRRRARKGRPLDCSECEAEPQRKTDNGGMSVERDGAGQAEDVASEPGRPLPESEKSLFERQMGADFSGVRVHTGQNADRAARSLNARAFTLGPDISFRSGEYCPDTSEGRRLLAHELTHVLQQTGARRFASSSAPGTRIQRQPDPAETRSAKTSEDESKKLKAASRQIGEARATAAADVRARHVVLTSLLRSDEELNQLLKKVGPEAENVPLDVFKMQYHLRRRGLLSAKAVEEEGWLGNARAYWSIWDLDSLSEGRVPPEAIPKTLEAVSIAQQQETLRGHLRDVGSAETQEDRRKKVKELIAFAQSRVATYPERVDTFIQQPVPSTDEKVRILGRVAAAAARLNFLTGVIFVGGSAERHKWEPKGKNRGYLPNRYNAKGRAWCTRFATKVRASVLGGEDTSSGFRLANPEQFPNDFSVEEPRYDEASGGAFVGARFPRSARRNPAWNDLRTSLEQIQKDGSLSDVEKEEKKKETLDSFFQDHLKPQAGDFMVVRRSSSPAHSFSAKEAKSHTIMIERFADYRIYTIEGNKQGRVTGREFNLLDPKHVREIIYIARMGLPMSEKKGATAGSSVAQTATQTAGGQVSSEQRVLTETDLLAPLQQMSNLLQEYALLRGMIDRVREDEIDAVANMVHHEIGATQGGDAG
ncbi:MAG: DUF4157 domain-containing protein [Salinibacter sp.]|uniref:eCIS core domain-containing protein n=1 Tax=Salinibacter sp. TaxID=2065818 RepID=UPI002FC32BF0